MTDYMGSFTGRSGIKQASSTVGVYQLIRGIGGPQGQFGWWVQLAPRADRDMRMQLGGGGTMAEAKAIARADFTERTRCLWGC